MTEYRFDLLQPSLRTGTAGTVRICSATTGYIVSFLGGPIAGALIALYDSWYLARLRTDWWLLPLAAGSVVGILLTVGGRGVAIRIGGLVFFALVYWLHGPFYRAMELSAEPARSPWIPGIGAVVTGSVINIAIAYATGHVVD